MAVTPLHLQPELSPTPSGSHEPARAFYQSRISLFYAVMSITSYIFFGLHNTLEVQFGNLSLGQVFTLPLNHWHLASASIGCGLWLFTRAFPLSVSALDWLDGVGALVYLGADYMMGSTILGQVVPHFDLVLTLAYMLFHMTHAVIVPSTMRRTLALCTLTAAPLLSICWLLAARAPDAWSSGRTAYAPLYVGLWCLECAIPAALASRVIYGLRQQVRKVSQLGQYTLEERLGEGGMGTVYRARHAMLRRPTAVKLLRAERTGEQALLRFEREVQLTSRLTHPNTVAIYDYGRTADGIFYYAMEYLDGLDLQRLVELDGPQPPARVVHVLVQVCRALNEAHGMGLIHRDIKPANIIMCERGAVPDIAKVVDFGLVKSIGRADDSERGDGPALSQPDLQLSAAHVLLGTPHFLSPEAIRSADAVDARSDLYALGGVGYFLLTGKNVFEGESILEVCAQQLSAVPARPSQHAPRPVPSALEEVLLRCLAKDPDARPQSALALLAELQGCGIPHWNDAQASSWWARRAGDRERSAERRSPTLLEVDVRERVRSG